MCDCWLSDCAWDRLLNGDYKWETKEELHEMFKDYELYKYVKDGEDGGEDTER